MDWKYMFSSIILERGYDYFICGHVSSLKRIDGGYKATVNGTDDYYVRISCGEEEISDMDCTCPYADDGGRCKHMAAVLYAVENHKDTNNDSNPHIGDDENKSSGDGGGDGGGSGNGGSDSVDCGNGGGYMGDDFNDPKMIREIVSDMAPDDLRQELISILINDENLGAGFIMRYTRSKKSISHYIDNMTQTARIILQQCSDKHEFVDWRNANTFMSRLIDEVIDVLEDFAAGDVEERKAAFDISLYVYDLYANTDIDDDGQTQIFTDRCLEFWEEILTNANSNDLAKYMLDKLILQSGKIGIDEYMAESIDDFISEQFNEDGFTATKLEMLDARIARYENDNSWSGGFNLSKSITERLSIMEESGYPPGEIEAFREKYWHLPAVREARMMELESDGKTSELIKLLKESMEIDHGLPGLVSKYSRKLVDCYKKIGEIEKSKDELFSYITVYTNGDINAFVELKQYYSDAEWASKREEIFSNLLIKHIDIKSLLATEGLKARLFEILESEVSKNGGLARFKLMDIGIYEPYLRPDYDEELLHIYETLIQSMAEYAGGRSYYIEIVTNVKKMFKYPGGKERVKKLLESWRMRYSNRSAMQDELQVLYREIYTAGTD